MKSDKYNYIFVHIPKNAGTSVELALLEAEGIITSDVNALTETTQAKYWVGAEVTHAPLLKCLRWWSNIHMPHTNNPFSFTIVRNPWSRIVSEYNYCLAGGVNNELTLNYSFKEFCYKWRDCELNSSQVYPQHLRPQHEFISSDIDYIGRFECLARSFNVICSHLGIPVKSLPAVNVSTIKTDYVDYYDTESRKLVRQIFARDIDEFCYTFEGNVW